MVVVVFREPRRVFLSASFVSMQQGCTRFGISQTSFSKCFTLAEVFPESTETRFGRQEVFMMDKNPSAPRNESKGLSMLTFPPLPTLAKRWFSLWFPCTPPPPKPTKHQNFQPLGRTQGVAFLCRCCLAGSHVWESEASGSSFWLLRFFQGTFCAGSLESVERS